MIVDQSSLLYITLMVGSAPECWPVAAVELIPACVVPCFVSSQVGLGQSFEFFEGSMVK